MNHDSRSFEDDLSSLKADVAAIRSNYVTKAELQAVRIELKTEISSVTAELKSEISSVTAELKDEIQSGQSRLKEEIAELRMEFRVDFERLRVEIAFVRAEFYKALDAQTWKIIGSTTVLVSAVYFIVRAGY